MARRKSKYRRKRGSNIDFLLRLNNLHDGKEIIYEMDEISGFDIDREIDFRYIEFLLEKGLFSFE